MIFVIIISQDGNEVMTNCEKLYRFYTEHPKSSTDETAQAMEWDKREVSRYKFRLKRRGFIGVDERDGVVILRPFRPEDDGAEAFSYKQQVYRDVIETLQERMNLPETTTTQCIDIGREIRIILKEIL